MSTTVSPSRIGQIAVAIQDLERAVSFYKEVLGLTFLFQAPPGLAFFDCAGVRLMLSKPETPEHDHPASIIYYQVDDLASAYQRAVDGGAEGLHEPRLVAPMPDHDLWMAFIKDSEDNTLGLMSEVRPPVGRDAI